MKKILLYILINLTTTIAQAQYFTGIITMDTENIEMGEKSTVKIFIKNKLCKMEINATTSVGTNAYTLFYNSDNSDITMVSGGTKTTIASSSAAKSKYLENILIATPTHVNQNILGYDCTVVKLRSTQASIDCLVATDLQINLPVYMQGGILQSLKENGITGTPLEISVKDLSGKTVISQKITSIVAQELSDSIFNN